MKILLADDHALFREGMRHVLGGFDEEIEVFEAEDLARALDMAAQHPDLDLLLLDLNMPGSGGVAGVNLCRTRFPALPLAVLSASEDRSDVEAVIRAGALGYIPKSSSGQVLRGAVSLILAGGVYLPSLLLLTAPPREPTAREADGEALLHSLTERQRQVLGLLAQGKPNKIIARDLSMGEGTVKVHLSAVFKLLNVNNRTEAVIAVRRLGLFDEGAP